MIEKMLNDAREATQGEWRAREASGLDGTFYVEGKSDRATDMWLLARVSGRDGPTNGTNARHIANCSPANIIPILERYQAMEAFVRAFDVHQRALRDFRDARTMLYPSLVGDALELMERAESEMIEARRKVDV